jgi:uncharacterized Ntn-hydrolase superfamily protein
MNTRWILCFVINFLFTSVKAQDTFSIVALDSTTRYVGSAGASCLDLNAAGYSDPSFLSKLLPDSGAVNIQSYFMQQNQDNALAQLRLNKTAPQVISWLVANDANANPEFKQHGVVSFLGGGISADAHSGSSCINYKNHIVGNHDGFYYAIQGNILLGQEVLDSMESKFIHTTGDLACKLMAAMQGAKMPGADTRCTAQGISSKFAFLQVSKPTDSFGSPYFKIGLATTNADTIEPIDSLQVLFNAKQACFQPNSLTETNSYTYSLSNPMRCPEYVGMEERNPSRNSSV